MLTLPGQYISTEFSNYQLPWPFCLHLNFLYIKAKKYHTPKAVLKTGQKIVEAKERSAPQTKIYMNGHIPGLVR